MQRYQNFDCSTLKLLEKYHSFFLHYFMKISLQVYFELLQLIAFLLLSRKFVVLWSTQLIYDEKQIKLQNTYIK